MKCQKEEDAEQLKEEEKDKSSSGGKCKMGFKSKKFLKTGLGITTASVGLGVGAQVAGAVPGANVAGIANLSGSLPAVGTIAGAGFALGALGGLTKVTKKLKTKKF